MTPAQRIASAMPAAHKLVSRMLGLTLFLGKDGDLQPYLGLIKVLRAALTQHERQAVAWAAMMACDDDEALSIAQSVVRTSVGMPEPPFDPSEMMADAEFWADQAEDLEQRTYVMVLLSRMTKAERQKMIAVLDGRNL